LVPRHPLGSLARHAAAADVDVHGGPPVEPLLDEPVRLRRPGLLAPPSFGHPLPLCCDPLPGALEVGELDTLQEAEHLETGGRAIVHMFDSRF
jgi:hypothetical protein